MVRSIAIAAVLCGFAGCATDDAPRLSRSMIHLIDLDGKSFDLWLEPQTITVVLFTRSDCPISNRSAPEVRRLYDEFQSRGVAFYLIYVDPREQPEDIRQHLKEYGYPCPALRDPKHTLVEHCGATITPEAVVFNQNREMAYRGRIDDLYADFGQARTEPTTHDLGDAIESLLSGRKISNPRTNAVGCLIKDLKG